MRQIRPVFRLEKQRRYIHGSGRRVQNVSEGITIQLEKAAEAAGELNYYIYIIMDAQLNIESGRFHSAIY